VRAGNAGRTAARTRGGTAEGEHIVMFAVLFSEYIIAIAALAVPVATPVTAA
jgi:hypothetical protein